MSAAPLTTASLIAALALTGCVSRGKYDATLSEARQARADVTATERAAARQLNALLGELRARDQALAEARVSLAGAEQELEFAGGLALACGQALDESSAANEALQSELERLGEDVDQLTTSRAELSASLERARAGVEELRRAKAAADERAALFREVAQRLRRMLDSGELKISLRSGRMVLALPADILFDSGRAQLGKQGRVTLEELGAALATAEGRRFQVSGHTDSDPIRTTAFASNWELSTARALSVVAVLIEAGVQPALLSAAGYAEFDPLAENDNEAGKAMNRRIEITLQPNIDELVDLPLLPPGAATGHVSPSR